MIPLAMTIQFDRTSTSQSNLLKIVSDLETQIEASISAYIPCREFTLPVVFDHPAIAESTQRYTDTIRQEVVYLPDNIEYIRQNNGLKTRQQVFDIVTNSSFLVVAVGFLIGTPILFPLNPLSGLVTQK